MSKSVFSHIQLSSVHIAPASRHMGLRKRNRAIQVGDTYYVHKKVYKMLTKRGADIERILSRIRVPCCITGIKLSNDLITFDKPGGFKCRIY